jgi:hypothetical protein
MQLCCSLCTPFELDGRNMRLPAPRKWGSFDVEPFSSYRLRWPAKYSRVPDTVVENWVHRHWRDFQRWLPLNPLDWEYEIRAMTKEEIMSIRHVGDWMSTLDGWGDDLLDGRIRKTTWLGRYLLENGTTPAPIIVATSAGSVPHPREHGHPLMSEPYQLVEGHLRLAYLRGMIRRRYGTLQSWHQVVVATIQR